MEAAYPHVDACNGNPNQAFLEDPIGMRPLLCYVALLLLVVVVVVVVPVAVYCIRFSGYSWINSPVFGEEKRYSLVQTATNFTLLKSFHVSKNVLLLAHVEFNFFVGHIYFRLHGRNVISPYLSKPETERFYPSHLGMISSFSSLSVFLLRLKIFSSCRSDEVVFFFS
jgi:hypothetical protein